jgi:hypothetical protein
MNMTNILVADSGSTKTQWILFRNGKTEIPFTSLGINPFYQDTDSIISIIKPMLIKNVITQPEHIFFYGAGCGNQKQWIVYDALKQIYPEVAIFVGSDLLGAARSLCQSGNAGFLFGNVNGTVNIMKLSTRPHIPNVDEPQPKRRLVAAESGFAQVRQPLAYARGSAPLRRISVRNAQELRS